MVRLYMNDKLHEFILFLLLMSFSFMSDNSNKNNLYTYNDNGRIVVPTNN